jgi:RHS repeat-associated protein
MFQKSCGMCEGQDGVRHPTLPTRNAFTGQVSYVSDDATDLGSSGFGLMFYQSRWYDPSLGRMAQADTIVPGGVQGLDRYAYVNNSPLNYVDPSGHFACRDGQSGYQCKLKLISEVVTVAGGVSCQDTDYCDLDNGARLDERHFRDGVNAWITVLNAWYSKEDYVDISSDFAFVPPTTERFSLEGIESVTELRARFLTWYVYIFQLKFEETNWGYSHFNTEDIPSAVIGATMASYNITEKKDVKTLAKQMNNNAKDYNTRVSTIYALAVNLLGGGTGTNEKITNGPKNTSWFLMTYDGNLIPYPADSQLDILNHLSGFLFVYSYRMRFLGEGR